ncbi:MAG TPA: DUF1684 domain-containing protein [Stellaceae bacterium]|nr:DUF1684 domain-containing protein [Stellaceae bacterium]
MSAADAGRLALWDWRRRIVALYAEIRGESDPARAWRHWRETRDALFRTHPQTPLETSGRDSFKGLAYGNYDPRLRFAVALVPIDEMSAARYDGGGDGALLLTAFARTEGLASSLGRELTLYWIEGYAGSIFLPFRDTTSGVSSYAGGRYLLDSAKGADLGQDDRGRTILDFNFAYNPSCAYSPRWLCPLSPRENTLEVAVEGGEQV